MDKNELDNKSLKVKKTDNKKNYSYEELWAYAQENNCTLKDAKKRIYNK